MSSVVQVRQLRIGEGRSKICVPIAASTVNEIKTALREIKSASCDLVEWRADYFEQLYDPDAVKQILQEMRECLGNIPLIFTIRTMDEGGEKNMESDDYLRINLLAIETGWIDFIDVEMFLGDDIVFILVEEAHQRGTKVIISNHDFEHTPKKEELLTRLCKMQELEADIAKIAVMPKSERDVLTLLDATLTMKELHHQTPVITMSMGNLGKITRMTGSVFGSAITFGCMGTASAPGQIPAGQLTGLLDILE